MLLKWETGQINVGQNKIPLNKKYKDLRIINRK